jgi:hypothetical protein
LTRTSSAPLGPAMVINRDGSGQRPAAAIAFAA